MNEEVTGDLKSERKRRRGEESGLRVTWLTCSAVRRLSEFGDILLHRFPNQYERERPDFRLQQNTLFNILGGYII